MRGCRKVEVPPKVRQKTLGVFFMKYSFDFRLHIVSQVKSGYAIKGLSLAYGLHENKILDWVRLFSLYGEDGLRKPPRTKASVDFKQGTKLAIEERPTFYR